MKALIKIFVVTAFVLCGINSVDAAWLCKAHNARGQVFYGQSGSHFMADAEALKNCAVSSQNCTIDSCERGGVIPPQPTVTTWECDATNARGQKWVGTGESRAVAASNASGFCTAHSSRAANCRIKSCFIKQ